MKCVCVEEEELTMSFKFSAVQSLQIKDQKEVERENCMTEVQVIKQLQEDVASLEERDTWEESEGNCGLRLELQMINCPLCVNQKGKCTSRKLSKITVITIIVQSPSCVQLFCDPMDCSLPGFPVSLIIFWNQTKFMSIALGMSSNHLILCCLIISNCH